jgi:hypothetical protein
MEGQATAPQDAPQNAPQDARRVLTFPMPIFTSMGHILSPIHCSELDWVLEMNLFYDAKLNARDNHP